MNDLTSIPITVFTGYLGAGKTTIIKNLVEQLPKDYRSVWLKNEFGDLAVDSELMKETNIAVKEMLNGCLCCVLVGRLGEAIKEIVTKHQPERIIIETSGTAFPGPIALAIKELAPSVALDGLVVVVDMLNFSGYLDRSFTAKLQTKYTDLILLNKHESLTEVERDDVLDDIYELNPDTPKVETVRGWVDKDLVFSLESHPARYSNEEETARQHDHLERIEASFNSRLSRERLKEYLTRLDGERVYRLKGAVKLMDGGRLFVNCVAGRCDFIELGRSNDRSRLLAIGRELKGESVRLADELGLAQNDIKYLAK